MGMFAPRLILASMPDSSSGAALGAAGNKWVAACASGCRLRITSQGRFGSAICTMDVIAIGTF